MSTIKIRQNDTFEDIPTLEGAQGVPGPQGPAGNGVPTGGNENDILIKQSSTDYDTIWVSLVDKVYPIGSYYETSDISFNPNISFGGVWEQEEDGTVLASRQTTVGGSALGANVGEIVGEENHVLTIDEMPKHAHAQSLDGRNDEPSAAAYQWIVSSNRYLYTGDDLAQPTGGGLAHNNVQPTKIVCRWHRTG